MQQQRKDPLEGSIVDGRYLVHSRLARGGMSTVYLATDRRLDRRVALKVLYPHLADEPGFVDRFEQEAKSAARLSHPHVVGVLDQGVDDVGGETVAYLVMEFVRGRTLRDELREHGRLTPRHALALLEAVVEGLAAAHEAGLIHRDVKPENVLLSDTGQVKIADFGLARAASASTGTATLVGTVAYLSPELVLGRPAEAQSDIYSTGVMLFELLTGRQPFTGEVPVQVALQHAQQDVPAPSTLVPGLAADIDELVQWCPSRDPEARPAAGAALLGDLRHIRANLSPAELDLAPGGVPPTGTDRTDQLTVGAVPVVTDGSAPTDVLPPSSLRGVSGPTQPAREEMTQVMSRPVPEGTNTDTDDHDDGNSTRVIRRDENTTRVIGAPPGRPPSSASHEGPGRGRSPGRGAGGTGTYHRQDAGSPRSGASVVPGVGRAPGADGRRPSRRQAARAARRPRASLPGRARRRLAPLLVVLLVLLAALVTAGSWFFGAGPAGTVTLPDLADRPLAEARSVLIEQGIGSVSTQEVFDDDVLAGLVVGTDPAAATEIRRYEQVELLVSRGPELFAVPDVTGENRTRATAELEAAGFAPGGLREEYSETIGAGVVLAQDPGAGAERPRGTAVELVVSRGPAPIAVPDVRGSDEADAVAALEDAGLRAEVSRDREYSGTVPAGAVLAQSPADGAVQRGTTVTLT
ncbi:hypothetical protein AC792_14020, partial [Arthrobacter sp. RIT-PI-e]|uniref:protein kinase domain-containing protein n=1 Tax=Arthrobacter sp. RIT-PI-e TaxID=1681197 RepID=UPI00067648B7